MLREMRRNNIRMAIGHDGEYGGVAGLVTIEDLIAIVGEIGDEHEKSQVIKENDHSYIVPDIDHLDELFRAGRERSYDGGRPRD